MTQEVRGLLSKSKHAIKVAQDLLAQGYPSDSASKAYYAIFYAAQALLKSARIDVIKHSAVEAAIGYHFVKTAKIDQKYHRILLDARKLREIADYDIQEEIIRPQAATKILEAKDFLKLVQKITRK